MRSASLSFTLLLVASLAALPAQAQELGIHNPNVSTPTSLYFHVIDFQDMPINTQLPDPSFAAGQGYAAGTATLKCLHPLTGNVSGSGQGTRGTTSQILHTAYGYSSPSYVEYDYVSADGTPRIHPERGISYDAVFDPDYAFTLEWYVAVYNGGGDADQVPTPTPGVVIAAAMRAGDGISIDDRAYDSGTVLAEGRTEPATLVPSPVPGVGGAFGSGGGPHQQVDFVGVVDGKYVYRFRVPMDLQSDRIQRATGFNVRIDMFVDNPYCTNPTDAGKEYIMPSTLAAYSSDASRPRLDLAIMNPIRLEFLHPQFVGDDLVIHTALNSAWGNYDVKEATPDGIRVSIAGPTQAKGLAQAAFVQRFHDHYHHQEAVDMTYVWDYKTDRAAQGEYKVFVEFENDQGTAKASGTALFEIGKGQVPKNAVGCGEVGEASQELTEKCITTESTGDPGPAQSPGLPVAFALAALGAMAAALRRKLH
jgi:hypothetical protein